MTRASVFSKIGGGLKKAGKAAKGLGHRISGFFAKGGESIGTGLGQMAKGVGEGGQELFR